MKNFTKPSTRGRERGTGRISALIAFLVAVSFGVSAQTVSWTDSFDHGAFPTASQCLKWNTFLDDLGDKSFASVTLTGSLDNVGKTIQDPALATELARLLSTRTNGTVQVGNEYWTVAAECGTAVTGCGEYASTALSVTTDGPESCGCGARYAVRAGFAGADWGGVNSATCFGPKQTMSLVFNPAVTIEGPTTICSGDEVTLTANAVMCSGPYTYHWSNNKTTPSITVSEAGDYWVEVTSADECTGRSDVASLSVSEISVDAGKNVTICSEGIQLSASGTSGGGGSANITKYCLFDAPGGLGNCSFTNNLCSTGDGSQPFTNKTFSQTLTGTRPDDLRVFLYYSANDITNFTVLLNNTPLGSYVEVRPVGNCTTVIHPFTFAFDELAAWNPSGVNTVDITVSTGAPVFISGVTVETEYSNEVYSWTPVEGLDDPSVHNPTATPSETTTYTVTFTDANHCTATDDVTVTVNCNPVAACKSFTAKLDENCKVTVKPEDFDDGSFSPIGLAIVQRSITEGPYKIGDNVIELTVIDEKGGKSSCTTTLTVVDERPPLITAPPDITVVNDPGTCSATLDPGLAQASDNCDVPTITNDLVTNTFPVGETVITWKATDARGGESTAVQKVTVVNNDPVINTITASAPSVDVGQDVTLTVAYSDNNVSSASVDWGDMSAPDVVPDPANTFDITHAYAATGTYAVTVTVTDQCDATASRVFESIVVVSKHAGSVKGNGWFDSKPGYYLKDRRASGKAHFHFSASYARQGGQLQGKITFTFKEGSLDFKSTGLDMLDVDGPNAFLTGSGKLNNKKDYRILIGMYDDDPKGKETFTPAGKPDAPRGKKDDHPGGKKDDHPGHKKVDRIRVKIWDPHGIVVYDTQAGSADDALASVKLGGGSIAVSSSALDDMDDDDIASHFEEGSTDVYPNPFEDWLSVHFTSESREKVNLQLMDLAGKVIFNQTYRVSDDGSYSIDLPKGTHKGLYVLVIKQGKRVEFLRVIRK